MMDGNGYVGWRKGGTLLQSVDVGKEVDAEIAGLCRTCPNCGANLLEATTFGNAKIWLECIGRCGWPDQWQMDYRAALKELSDGTTTID